MINKTLTNQLESIQRFACCVILQSWNLEHDDLLFHISLATLEASLDCLWGGEWVHCLFLFPLVLGKNVVVTCKIESFLCSLDNLPQKNVIVVFVFLEIKFQNGPHLKKELFLTNFSNFLVTRERLQKFLQHISHLHTCILLTLLTFLPYQF